MRQRGKEVTLDPHPCVGEREQRHDHERHPGVQRGLEPLQRRLHLLGRVLHLFEDRFLLTRRFILVSILSGALEHEEKIAATGEESRRGDTHTDGYRCSNEDACNRRVYSGMEECQPDGHAKQRVHQRMPDAEPPDEHERGKEDRSYSEVPPHDVAGVEDGNDDHGADVVDDGERRQEDF